MNLEDQELLFSIFHDGSIFDLSSNDKELFFSIDIMYLAERLNPTFRYFTVQILNPSEFYFEVSESKRVVNNEEINNLGLEILKTEMTRGKIRVFCSANNGDTFGFLNIKTRDIQIFDQERKRLELKQLEVMAREYWDEFGRRSN
jgi:hypothetical protein